MVLGWVAFSFIFAFCDFICFLFLKDSLLTSSMKTARALNSNFVPLLQGTKSEAFADSIPDLLVVVLKLCCQSHVCKIFLEVDSSWQVGRRCSFLLLLLLLLAAAAALSEAQIL
jgi:hypothetical protein